MKLKYVRTTQSYKTDNYTIGWSEILHLTLLATAIMMSGYGA